MNADKLNYLYAKETKRFSDWVNRKYLEISDIQSPRVLNHWEKNNIIPISGSYKKHTRRIYSLIDLLWLLILKELREFGVPLQSLYGIKHWISTFPANKELPDLPKEYYKVINERVSNSTNYNLEFAFYHCFVERKLAYLVTNSLGEGRVLSHTDLMLEVNNMVVANMVIINIHAMCNSFIPNL